MAPGERRLVPKHSPGIATEQTGRSSLWENVLTEANRETILKGRKKERMSGK